MTEGLTLFWGGPFSQWHPSDFVMFKQKFNCAEQFMMAYKALKFRDFGAYKAIMKSDNPRKQKAIGRKVKNFNVDEWAKIARDIVRQGSIAKYTQNLDLCKELVNTYPTTLVEASPYDKIWGIGLSEYSPEALDRSKWQGKNWLGQVLTEVRDSIMRGYTKHTASEQVVEKLSLLL